MNLNVIFFNFFWNRTGFFSASNVNVQHKGLLLQDWVFRLVCRRKYATQQNLFYSSSKPFSIHISGDATLLLVLK